MREPDMNAPATTEGNALSLPDYAPVPGLDLGYGSQVHS
jgi:hypothetical protein